MSNDVDVTFSGIKNADDFCKNNANSDSVIEIFEPFIHDSFVSLKNDLSNTTTIKILRDNGS